MHVFDILCTLFPIVTVNIIGAGISGDNAPGGLARVERDILRHEPDLTVVCYGLNDCSRDEDSVHRYVSALGEIFEKHVLQAGQNSRGVKLRPGLTVLNATRMPAVLNEGAFVDNKKDIADWNEEAELKVLGIAYAKAAAEFLKLEKKAGEIVITLPVLAYGSKGETVEVMQTLLKAAGYKVGTTGNFGSGTEIVLLKAQSALGLPATGKTDGNSFGSFWFFCQRVTPTTSPD